MGFYGNVTNTDKTTFSFDLTYTTRIDMDRNANIDGVFLGRYVLVDYDGEVIKAYYNPETDRFYSTTNFSISSMITPRENIIVQNLYDAMSPQSFYEWSESKKVYKRLDANTPYQARFAQDVKEYGRAYDSTVWVKRYDTVTGGYKYAMIAELNAVVPTLHMVVNQPNTIPVTPYFDRDTTNIDYYLHMQSDFGTRVKKADQNIKSDEEATRIMAHWTQDASGHQTYHEYSETVPADIYYNNDGFDPVKRTYMEDKITYRLKDDNGDIIEGTELKEIDYSVNSIGYDMGQSGRKYGIDADFGVYTNGTQADDIYDWYFRLPGIGNAICKMWDKVYDDRGNGQVRSLNKAQKENDTDNHLVSYNKETLIGMMNTAQELLGYHFIPTNETYKAGYSITDGEAPIENTLVYNMFDDEASVSKDTSVYKLLNCLFYDKPEQENRAVTQYYHFAYTPTYTPVTGEELEKGVTYYHFVNGKWELANPAIYKQNDANGDPIVDVNTNQTLAIGSYHTRNNKWTLVPLESGIEDNFYSLINLIHNLIGTDADDVRSLDTMKGTINHIKDIIANIDLDLSPGKLLHTNNSGIIETTDTYFPSAVWDEDKVLNGKGEWVNHYASIKVRKNSENANRKIPKVVSFDTTEGTAGSDPVKLAQAQQKQEVNEKGEPIFNEDGTPKMIDIELTPDNQRIQNGATLTYKHDHDPNTLIFATRDKWIKLHPDDKDDSIEFEHTQSPLVDRLYVEKLDNPGEFKHLDTSEKEIDSDTKQETGWLLNSKIKHPNFKVNFEEQINEETGKIEEVAIGTELLIQSDTDNLTYNSSVTDANDNRLTIPTITVDNAGHVIAAGTRNFNIPHSFKKIKTSTIDDDNEEESIDKSGMLVADSINDELELAPQNRWIDIAIVEESNQEKDQDNENLIDKITFGHKLVKLSDVVRIEKDENNEDINVYLNKAQNAKYDDLRLSDPEIVPTVYRYGLPQDKDISMLDKDNGTEKANTFNVPYIEVDKAGHIVAAATHTIEIPENFTTVTLKSQDESTSAEAHTVVEDTVLAADTLTDNLTLKTVNRWIGIGLTDNNDNDEITFGHRLSDIKNVASLELNGDRRANKKYEKVYRYGLPQDKSISDLDEIFGGYDDNQKKIGYKYDDQGQLIGLESEENLHEKANTFNVPYMEIDEAGHIVHAETHTVEIPHTYNKISTGAVINDEASQDEAGHTIDTLAKEVTGIKAETLSEEIQFASSNKWIRIDATGNTEKDIVKFGHEIHTIKTSSNTTDLDETNNKDIITKSIEWDKAGHIISGHTETWKLPYSLRNIHVTTATELSSIENNSKAAEIEATQISDTFKFTPANNWIRLQANDHEISFGHLTQGTADTYGTNLEFAEFGGSVTLYGYKTDAAGHVIDYPTYTLTLPKGKYTPTNQGSEGASVITGINFIDSTGEIISTAVNVGTLKLTDYTKLDTTENAVIKANNTINQAFAKLDDRIETEEETRASDINNLRMFKTINVANTDLVADSNADTLTIAAGNDGIVLTPTDTDDSFTIGHKTGHEAVNGFYKLSTDAYGHVSSTTGVALEDLTALGVATQENLNKHINTTAGNPHSVTAAEVGLGNVVNESKETMFTNATLTGVPTAPTAEEGTNTTQIATTAFANEAIKEATRLIWEDLKNNYNLVLKQPTITISQTVSEDKSSAQLVVNTPVAENDIYSYNWSTGDTNNIIEVTENGTYTCIVTRTHNGYTSEAESSITITEIVVPEIPEEPIEPQPEEPIV